MANEPHGNQHSGWEAWGSGDLEARGTKPWGTLVNVTLVVETSGSLRHLLYRLMGGQKTEQYLDEVLSRLNSFPVAQVRPTCSGFIGRRVAMGRLSGF